MSEETGLQRALTELVESRATEAERQRVLFRRMHGHLCTALSHLSQAAEFSSAIKPDLTGKISTQVKALAAVLPDYTAFDAATSKPKRPQ
jgi:hypothetical protein